jgi:site-specific DNA-methyltransferase (adenine-specific)
METIKVVKITDIKGNPNNPRIIKDDKFKKLVESIKAFPEMVNVRPIVVNTDMIVLGGNMRLKAMKEAGWKEAPIQIVNWDEQKQKEFIVKDNVGYGEWDWDDLANNWDAEELIEWGLDIPHFDAKVLEAEEDDFAAPEGGIETDIVLGDLFEIGEHRLLCGDSTDSDQVAKLMNGQKADMVFTDPPYGVDYQGGALTKRTKLDNDQKNTSIYQEVIPNLYLFTIDKAPMYIWHAAGYADMASHLWNNDIQIRSQIIWNKNMAQFGALSAQYKQKHEPCFYCYKKGQSPYWYGPTNEVTVWDVKRESKNEYHPTQKPIELSERAINNSSKVNDLVLDLFGGSGSTMVASQQLNRKARLMELDPKYCQVIVDRMKKLDPTLIIKKNGITI